MNEFAKRKTTWEEDFDSLIPYLIDENKPCYLLFRLDSKNSLGYEWLLLSWIPEDAPVREKMIYASTKATLKNQFGSGQIKEDILCTHRDDVTFKGYLKHRAAVAAPAPLTQAEEELAIVKATETNAHIGYDTKQQTLTGVAFPISEPGIKALLEFKLKKHNYVQLSIDLEKEIVNLESTEPTTVNVLGSRVPKDHGRYHLFRFPHTHEGDYLESVVFIYSMPGYACSIRERMLYSSCKGPITDIIENKVALPIDKKIEVENGDEITEEFVMDELHPKKNLHQPKFDKPKGPPGRGARRLMRKTDGEQV